MKRLLLALLISGCVYIFAAQTPAPNEESAFQPAEALSVTDITVPFNSIANGTVVLEALVGETGKVEKVEVRRGLVSVTEPAVKAVAEWEFSPATFQGKAVASRVPVAVNVRPPLWYADPVPLPPLKPQTDSAIQAEFQPAEVLRAVFPDCPENNVVNSVSVALEVTLSATGKAENIKVLQDVSPFTADAKAVVGDWRFMPAAYNGKPVPSSVILVFVFRPPVATEY